MCQWIKAKWRKFWRDDEYDPYVKHLSQSDKRELWYGAFMVCMSVVALCSFSIAFSNIRVSRQNSEDMEELMEMVATYMGSATKDEYEEIAKTIRHDLVFSEYGQEIENYPLYSQYGRHLPDMRRRVPVTGVPCVYQYGRTV